MFAYEYFIIEFGLIGASLLTICFADAVELLIDVHSSTMEHVSVWTVDLLDGYISSMNIVSVM